MNGHVVTASEGTTILDAARNNGIDIPTLCHLKDIQRGGLCKMCVVEVKGSERLMTACTTPAAEGMEIETDSELVRENRKETLDFICRNHRMECEYCRRYTDCDLHELMQRMGLDERKYALNRHKKEEIMISSSLVRDNSKCVRCHRCEAACLKQGMDTLRALFRGGEAKSEDLSPSKCVECGQCLAACPTGALRVVDESRKFWNAVRVSEKHVIAILDPSIYDSIGKAMHCNENVGEKLAWLLRRFGAKKVYPLSLPGNPPDDQLGGVTGGVFSLSANCPAAVQFIETCCPEYTAFLSGGKSLMERAARFCKDHYARSQNIDLEKVFCVVITPCTAAKSRVGTDMDLALTTIELDKVLEEACVSRYTKLKVWRETKGEALDELPGAAQRPVSGEGGQALYGLKQIANFLDRAKGKRDISGEIELFACEGGCAKGGGQLHNIRGDT